MGKIMCEITLQDGIGVSGKNYCLGRITVPNTSAGDIELSKVIFLSDSEVKLLKNIEQKKKV